jgi:hypothetical protein
MRCSSLLDIYDRPEKSAVSILYRVSLEPGAFRPRSSEIVQADFRRCLPGNSTPTAKLFLSRAHRNFGCSDARRLALP